MKKSTTACNYPRKTFPFLALSEFPVATTSFFSMAATPSSIFFSERWNTRTPSATFWLSPASMRSRNGCSPICSVSPYFKSARAKAAQPGHFGYWYRTIHTEPQNPDPISPNLNLWNRFPKNLLKILQLLARVRREYRTNHLLRLFIVLQKIPPAPGKPLPYGFDIFPFVKLLHDCGAGIHSPPHPISDIPPYG